MWQTNLIFLVVLLLLEKKQRKTVWRFSKFDTEIKKLKNLLKPSIKTILQHRADGRKAEKKGKQYFPWVLICSSNYNNFKLITTFFIFSLDMALL